MANRKTAPGFLSKQTESARYFFLPGRAGGMRVVCGGMERVRADYRIERTGFHHYGLEFVAAGRGTLRLAGRDHDLRPGLVFAYGPRVPHTMITHPRERLVKYFVDADGPGFRRLLQDGPLRDWTAVQTGDPAETRALFDALLRNGIRGGPRADAICAALLEALLLQIGEAAVAPERAQSAAYATYLRARELVERRGLEIRTLEELAAAVHADPAYLCRLFHRFDRQTPYQALLDRKLAHAAGLLREPGALVKNVAVAAGFPDAYHFSRVFKRRYGVPPAQFGGKT